MIKALVRKCVARYMQREMVEMKQELVQCEKLCEVFAQLVHDQQDRIRDLTEDVRSARRQHQNHVEALLRQIDSMNRFIAFHGLGGEYETFIGRGSHAKDHA